MRSPRAGGSPVPTTPRRRARSLRGALRAVARLAVMGTISVIIPSLNDAGFLAVVPRRARERRPVRPTRSSSSTTARRMPRPRSRSPRAHGWSTSRCAASGPRPRPGSTRHPATCSPASTPTPCRPRVAGRGRAADVAARPPTVVTGPACSTAAPPRGAGSPATSTSAATSPSIGALLGHPPVFGSNYAMRADARGSSSATSCTAIAPTCTTTSTSRGGCGPA